MRKTKQLLPLLALPFLLVGCSTTITNLTPKQLVRNNTGLYSVEARWDSNQRSIRKESIKPLVVVGNESYPMQLTPLTVNRYEALVPVPAGQKYLNYRFKFDFEYDSIPFPRPNSKMSPPYQMEVIEK